MFVVNTFYLVFLALVVTVSSSQAETFLFSGH